MKKIYTLAKISGLLVLSNFAFCENDSKSEPKLEKVVVPVSQGSVLQNYLENLINLKNSKAEGAGGGPFSNTDAALKEKFSSNTADVSADADPWDVKY